MLNCNPHHPARGIGPDGMVYDVAFVVSRDASKALVQAIELRRLGFPADWAASESSKGYKKAVARAARHELMFLLDEGAAVDNFSGERFDLSEGACEIAFRQLM
jgi:hypothetical protein